MAGILMLFLAFLSGFFFGIYYVESFSYNSATVYAAAVVSGGGGTLATITARLTPGYGRVFVSVVPKTEIDTQTSAQTAAYVAQRLAHIPLGFRDLLFTIRARTALVEGPSAGAAMTIAAYAALTGKKPAQDVVITGVISPDGSIGPVGGLLDKLHACAEGGIKYFLIPKGERYIDVLIPQKSAYSPLPGITIIRERYVRKRIDLYEEGNKLGVHVVEVSNIEQALPYFFNEGTS